MSKKRPYVCGLDLAEIVDHSAAVIVRENWDLDLYEVVHAEVFPLKTPFPEVVARCGLFLQDHRLINRTKMVYDATGYDRSIRDLFIQERISPFEVTITGGNKPNKVTSMHWRVPKITLVYTLKVLFQKKRIKISERMEGAPDLLDQLMNFEIKYTERGSSRYEASHGFHDDLVMALALVIWYGEHQRHKFKRIPFKAV